MRGQRVRRLVLGAIALVVLVVEGIRVGPEWAQAVGSIGTAQPALVIVGAGAIAVSMWAFARLRMRLLRGAGVEDPRPRALAMTYASTAQHLTLPGGAVFSTVTAFKWMRERGASTTVASWVLVAGGLVSAAALLVVGLAGVLAGGGGLTKVLVEAGLMVLLVLVVRVVMRHPERVRAAIVGTLTWTNKLLRRRPDAGRAAVDKLADELMAVRVGHRDWLVAGGYGLLNWATDLACLALCVAAVGAPAPAAAIVVAYVAGKAVAGVSPIPGGIGVVEATLVLALTTGGVPVAAAFPAVVLYRLVSMGGVALAGWIVLASGGLHAPRAVTGS